MKYIIRLIRALKYLGKRPTFQLGYDHAAGYLLKQFKLGKLGWGLQILQAAQNAENEFGGWTDFNRGVQSAINDFVTTLSQEPLKKPPLPGADGVIQ